MSCFRRSSLSQPQLNNLRGSGETQAVIEAAGVELVEIMVHSSYTAVYAHIIVVQDDENVVRGRRSIVQSFESQTATHRTVADDGNDVPSFSS